MQRDAVDRIDTTFSRSYGAVTVQRRRTDDGLEPLTSCMPYTKSVFSGCRFHEKMGLAG